jgi:hypothetical protein
MGLYVYNGSSWSSQASGFKLYNGSSWVNTTRGYVYDGSTWKQFYPEAPANTASPTFSWSGSGWSYGAPQTVTVSTGTWTNSPTSYSYQWERKTAFGSWSSISGATSSSFYADTTVVGYEFGCTVTATNARGSTSVRVSTSSGSPFPCQSPVTGFTATKTGSGTVYLSWNAAYGASQYMTQHTIAGVSTNTYFTSTSGTISGLGSGNNGYVGFYLWPNFTWQGFGNVQANFAASASVNNLP